MNRTPVCRTVTRRHGVPSIPFKDDRLAIPPESHDIVVLSLPSPFHSRGTKGHLRHCDPDHTVGFLAQQSLDRTGRNVTRHDVAPDVGHVTRTQEFGHLVSLKHRLEVGVAHIVGLHLEAGTAYVVNPRGTTPSGWRLVHHHALDPCHVRRLTALALSSAATHLRQDHQPADAHRQREDGANPDP